MRLARLHRLAALDGEEVRFRLVGMARRGIDRARVAIAPPAWDRRAVASLLSAAAPAAARDALRAGLWHQAHVELARHFAAHRSAFPLQPREIPALAAAIRRDFPAAAADAARRAIKVLSGKYDVLGYVDVPFGNPPDWHADPVNRKRASRLFWSAVPFLSPECGDHKVIWELNRHQHWIALGRNRMLNDDRACYAAFVAQLEDWLAQNPPLVGINWASMLELAFRSLSWLWALHLFAADALHDTPAQPPWMIDLLAALDRQLTHVERNLSRYFSPNTHLTGEALALYVAGHTLPELAASSRRVEVGRQILLSEIDRQVHRDGGHAELSAHYHRYAADFYLLALLIARRAGDPAAARFQEAARRMTRYLRTIADDSGMLPLIGDDDGGQTFDVSGRGSADASATLATAAVALSDPLLAVGPGMEETLWLCGHDATQPRSATTSEAWRSAALTESGYFVMRTRQRDHLVFDVGRHGFLNGGHAHSDALSLVLTLRGAPLFVDPGTGVYTTDPVLRDRFRSSAMHNTVVLNGKAAAEPDGPFHWRSRVDAEPTFWHAATGFEYAEGSHRGYGGIRHTRGVLAVHGFGWLIVDHLIGQGRVTADIFWHLHPHWTVSVDSEGTATLTHGSGIGTAVATTAGPLRVLAPGDGSGLTLFAPVYGQIIETRVLTSRASLDLPISLATFVAADPAIARDLRIDSVRVTDRPGDDWQTLGVELSFNDSAATVLCAAQRDPAVSPAQRRPWGAGDLRADGRVAARISRRTEPPLLIAVDGTLHDAGREPVAAAEPVLEHIS